MTTTTAGSSPRRGRRIRASSLGPWLVAGTVAWAGVAWIGWTLWQHDPPRAGFDLALLLEAARRVLAGDSPYDPSMLAGGSPDAVELFYSYPPPVAQAMTVLAWLPDGIALVLWVVAATTGLGLIAGRIGAANGRSASRMAVRAMAVAPLMLPFAIAALFGNLDVWYPLAYGALLLAVPPGASPRVRVAAGIAVAAVSIAKLHPAPLLLWVALRAVVERGGQQALVLTAAAVTIAGVAGASLLVGGVQPWLDYVDVVRVGSGSDLLDPRNAGPAALIGLAVGLDEVAVRWIQLAVTAGVVVVTVAAAVRIRDPLPSVGLASAATLATLPVTWYHYPVALMPLAIALAIRHPAARPRIVLALVVVDVAIAFLPLLWLAVAVLLVTAAEAARRSASAGRAAAAGATATRG